MTTLSLPGKRERVNFWIPADLQKRVTWAEKEFDFTRSDLFRQALAWFIEKLETEKNNAEIEAACEYYFEKDKKLAAEWRSAEGPV